MQQLTIFDELLKDPVTNYGPNPDYHPSDHTEPPEKTQAWLDTYSPRGSARGKGGDRPGLYYRLRYRGIDGRIKTRHIRGGNAESEYVQWKVHNLTEGIQRGFSIPTLLMMCCFLVALVSCKAYGEPHTVKRVIDGDTLELINGDRVRLCGVDAPENDQQGGAEATEFLRSLIGDGEVIIVPVERDRYGRLIGEVWNKDDEVVNTLLILEGHAWHYEKYSANCPNQTAIITAEELARDAGTYPEELGAIAPWEWRK
ncbi:MAG: thermonuclease family protein [Cyanobacteria bacterium P01_G01_bin.54]